MLLHLTKCYNTEMSYKMMKKISELYQKDTKNHLRKTRKRMLLNFLSLLKIIAMKLNKKDHDLELYSSDFLSQEIHN